ncbi:MAG: fumarylacetoacetase, partial [Terriglobales bacterium]
MASWVASANVAGADFPLRHLPYGAFRAGGGKVHLGTAIGDQILDLHAAADLWAGGPEALPAVLLAACRAPVLNPLLELGTAAASSLRAALLNALADSAPAEQRERLLPLLRPQAQAEMLLPLVVGDYTDFYASRHHAFNVGSLFRPASPLLPNYNYLPVGYHGRSSSLGVSPQLVRRPNGQRPAATPDGVPPDFGPCRQLDFELEVGFIIGAGNRLGDPIALARAESHVFGVCLLNDWSARDLQRWEYQPLGPFLGKNFATTISPWITPLEALAPFRAPASPRTPADPPLLGYLDDPCDRAGGGFNVILQAELVSSAMRAQGLPPQRLCQSNLQDLYWSMAQMVTHHASNGCNLRPGDLLGSGTVSGPAPDARACLLELSSAGRHPVRLAN